MATRTFTAIATHPNQPRMAVQGPIVRMQSVVASVDATDVLIFTGIKLPVKAIIHECSLAVSCDTASTTSISIVLAAGLNLTSHTVDWSSATFSGVWSTRDFALNEGGAVAAASVFPYTVSLSDDRTPRWVYPQLTVDAFTGSVTGSRTLRFVWRIAYSNLP